MRRAEAEAQPGAVVEGGRDRGALALGERGQVRALGQILPQQPVGVLVGAAFPGVVRGGEVDRGAQPALERPIHVELGAVIGRDGPDRIWFVAQERDRAPQSLLGADSRNLADADQAAFAFDDGDGGGNSFRFEVRP